MWHFPLQYSGIGKYANVEDLCQHWQSCQSPRICRQRVGQKMWYRRCFQRQLVQLCIHFDAFVLFTTSPTANYSSLARIDQWQWQTGQDCWWLECLVLWRFATFKRRLARIGKKQDECGWTVAWIFVILRRRIWWYSTSHLYSDESTFVEIRENVEFAMYCNWRSFWSVA